MTTYKNKVRSDITTSYIERDWLDAVSGLSLFYPAAGDDRHDLIEAFGASIDYFWFNDLHYGPQSDVRATVPREFRRVFQSPKDGDWAERCSAPIITRRAVGNGREYRYLEPATLKERYRHETSGRQISIYLRRGFGQYALQREFRDGEIGVFVHRRDSIGESGSNMWFLANRAKDHEPVSNLFSKLSVKLADKSIVVSDGSLTRFRFLKKYRAFDIETAYQSARKSTRAKEGFLWRCIGYLSSRHAGAPTLIWGLERQ